MESATLMTLGANCKLSRTSDFFFFDRCLPSVIADLSLSVAPITKPALLAGTLKTLSSVCKRSHKTELSVRSKNKPRNSYIPTPAEYEQENRHSMTSRPRRNTELRFPRYFILKPQIKKIASVGLPYEIFLIKTKEKKRN